MAKKQTPTSLARPDTTTNVLILLKSAGMARQMAGERVLELDRVAARQRSEPIELAKWRVLVEYRTDLLKSIIFFEFTGPKLAKAAARACRRSGGGAADAQAQADKVRGMCAEAEEQCIVALRELDASIRARPTKTTAPDRILEEIREPKVRIAMLATECYLREKQSDSAWKRAEFELLTITMGQRSRQRVDALIAEARKWQRENGRSGALRTLAAYVVGKLAKLPTESKKLR